MKFRVHQKTYGNHITEGKTGMLNNQKTASFVCSGR